MSQHLLQELRELISPILGVPADRLTEATSAADVEAWDSLAQLSIVLAIEEKYSVQFAVEEIQRMTSVGAISELLEAKMR